MFSADTHMKHYNSITLLFLFVLITGTPTSAQESDLSATSQGSIEVLDGEVEIEAVEYWDDGALAGVTLRGAGVVAVTIPPEGGEDPETSVIDYILDIRPALSRDPEERFTAQVAGVLIGLQSFPNEENIPTGEVTFKTANSTEPFEKASVYFSLNEDYEATFPVKLAVRVDQAQGTWDLYIGDDRWLQEMRYGGSEGESEWEKTIILESRTAGRSEVRGLSISAFKRI